MTFNFNHDKLSISDSLGVTSEELIELQVKFEYLKKEITLNVFSQVTTERTTNQYSLSKIIESLSNELTKEDLAFILAVEIKNDITSFFTENKEMITILLSEELLKRT